MIKKRKKSISSKVSYLEKELDKIRFKLNTVETLVNLFQIIAPIYDQGGFKEEIEYLRKKPKKFSEEIEILEGLQKHIEKCGRDKYGMNRTKTGEEITPDKIFIGGVYGLNTQPASFWLNKSRETDTWTCINHYCDMWTKSHIDDMVKNIKKLKTKGM